jgi:cytochrome c553
MTGMLSFVLIRRPILTTLLISLNLSLCEAMASPSEIGQILSFTPDIEDGRSRFGNCTHCHGTEGWGSYSGVYPQIAGQHASVLIKQLLDISAGRRNNPEMLPAARQLVNQGPQALANVAAYITSLRMNPDPGVGDADDDELERASTTFQKVCSTCHGEKGEGKADKVASLLQGQNDEYLLRQLKRIQAGERKNANPEMRELIHCLPEKELQLLATYIARLEPPENKLGPYNWVNPNFTK